MATDTSSDVVGHQISVVITTRNRAGLLRQAIESVLPSPLITSPEQIIVVDDDSQDETEEVARKFGATYVRHARHNIGYGRNAGLADAHTPYVAFLDDDDVWLPGNMEAHLAALEAHPNAAFAYGIAQCATEELEPILEPIPVRFPKPPLPSGLVPNELHKGYPQLGVGLFRQDAVASVGGSDPHIQYFQDADLMLRIAGHHEIVGVEVVGMLYRQRPPSKARSDYHWDRARREVLRWRPRHVGVSWTTAAKFPHRNPRSVLLALLRGRRRQRRPRTPSRFPDKSRAGTLGFTCTCPAKPPPARTDPVAMRLCTTLDQAVAQGQLSRLDQTPNGDLARSPRPTARRVAVSPADEFSGPPDISVGRESLVWYQPGGSAATGGAVGHREPTVRSASGGSHGLLGSGGQ